MRDEFLEEHHFEEDVIHQEEQSVLLGMPVDNLDRFKMILKSRVYNTADEREVMQMVVMAALEAEGLKLRRPEVIVEALLANPEMRAEAVCYVEEILKGNIQ